MTKVIGWDVETHTFEPGNMTPPLVCLTAAGGPDTLAAFELWLKDMARVTVFGFDPEDTAYGPDFWASLNRQDGTWKVLVDRTLALDLLLFLCEEADRLVAHNQSYDWAVMCNEFPGLLPLMVDLMEDGTLCDTMVREMLDAIANDRFNFDSRTGGKTVFSLAHLVLARFNTDISGDKKDPRAWRLRYKELDGVPVNEWPDKAVSYAIEDSVWARDAYLDQASPYELLSGPVVNPDGTYVNERMQTQAAFALHLMACHGVYTDAPAVEKFRQEVTVLVNKAEAAGRAAGFMIINKCKTCLGTGWMGEVPRLSPCYGCEGKSHEECNASGVYGSVKKTGAFKQLVAPKSKKSKKRLQDLVAHAYGGHPPMTQRKATSGPNWKPQVSTESEVLDGSGNPLLEEFAEGSFAIKLLETYYPILLRGVDTPITSWPNVLVRSGRTSWAKPNFQNPSQKGGFRECFVPRRGKVFGSVDWSTLELCALAQVNLHFFGESQMANAINAGRDLHLAFAVDMLRKQGEGIAYEEAAEALHDESHPMHETVNFMRDRAKPANFGFPGGLGVAAFVKYAKGYGITLTFNEAEELRDMWFEMWSEMSKEDGYFKMISDASDSPTGRFTVKQLYSNRLRGGCSYTSGANTYFQGLAADGAKDAMWELFKACYVDEESVLYGCRMWAFVHDEFLLEGPEETAHLWATEVVRIMEEAMARWIPDVVNKADPALMRRWSKKAKKVYNEEGHLVPYEDVKRKAA